MSNISQPTVRLSAGPAASQSQTTEVSQSGTTDSGTMNAINFLVLLAYGLFLSIRICDDDTHYYLGIGGLVWGIVVWFGAKLICYFSPFLLLLTLVGLNICVWTDDHILFINDLGDFADTVFWTVIAIFLLPGIIIVALLKRLLG